MSTPKIDRKAFLTTTVAACATVAFGGCSGESETGGTDDTGGTSTGGTATGGTSTSTGGTATGGSGGAGYVCTTVTNNGNHSHPLAVPGSDVQRGYQDAPYLLQDGGTGHTHTVEVTAYDFLYLQGGTPVTKPSTNDQGHMHDCVITCAPG